MGVDFARLPSGWRRHCHPGAPPLIAVRMRKLLLAALSLALAAPLPAQIGPEQVNRLRDAALEDEVAWSIVEDLTTEIGPRLGGTEAEARARSWAVARLKALGFKNVRVEEYRMPTWVRGAESAEIVSPFPQKMHVAALGASGATPPQGITAEIVGFESVDALRAAPAGSLNGKIAFVSHQMQRTQDGSGYSFAGPTRWNAPSIAATKGAAAIVIRSVGTDYHRNPHTGGTTWASLTPSPNAAAALGSGDPPKVSAIPAGALSLPDAENLQRMLERAGKRRQPVMMRLVLTPRWIGEQTSGNVIAEVPGRDPKAGIVLIGGHLDSWDLSPGAFDDAAGVAITAAAARRIMQAGRPRRTIRLVWFGAEEVGIHGGKAYAAAHRNDRHVLAAESDFGADRVWRVGWNVAPENMPLVDRVAAALAPLGIARGLPGAAGGPDVNPVVATGVAAIDLNQDGTRYFDLHHTPDDTLDKVDPEQLKQNVAAWTAMLAIVANAPEEIRPIPVQPAQ
jgi:carboxypeptidase Q